jgi:hypothetical protein
MDNLSDIFLKKFRNAKSDQKFARRGVAPRKKRFLNAVPSRVLLRENFRKGVPAFPSQKYPWIVY